MSEPESHTLAWMRRIDAKLDVLGGDLATIKADLAQMRDNVMVTSATCLRLEAGQERLEGWIAALEGREST
jgi:hypothetical protein